MKRQSINALALVACFVITGCATHYTTPSAGVSYADIADEDLRAYYEREPASPFPANIAIVRVQDSGYMTRTARGYGHGRYTTVTTRDIERDEDYERIVSLPLVRDVAPIGRMLMPPDASTIKDLRTPAAKLRADLLLVYSVDTTFSVEGKSLGPLTMVSLGMIRNKKAHVTATVAGVLVDVRTGFIYGTTEATAVEEQRASVWSTEQAIDTSRMRAEEKAFGDFVDEFTRLWKGVVDVHASTPPATPQPVTRIPEIEDRDMHYRIRLSD